MAAGSASKAALSFIFLYFMDSLGTSSLVVPGNCCRLRITEEDACLALKKCKCQDIQYNLFIINKNTLL